MLRSEIPSGMCAKLRTVAASNNTDHPTRSLSSSPLASTIKFTTFTSINRGHSPRSLHRDHSIIACSRHMYVWCCSSRTSRSWWITQSTQHHRRGCNNIHSFLQRTAPIARSLCEGWTPHDLHILVTAPFCCDRKSRSWWIIHLTQHHRRGCNNCLVGHVKLALTFTLKEFMLFEVLLYKWCINVVFHSSLMLQSGFSTSLQQFILRLHRLLLGLGTRLSWCFKCFLQ